jgi:hypothetical protein
MGQSAFDVIDVRLLMKPLADFTVARDALFVETVYEHSTDAPKQASSAACRTILFHVA